MRPPPRSPSPVFTYLLTRVTSVVLPAVSGLMVHVLDCVTGLRLPKDTSLLLCFRRTGVRNLAAMRPLWCFLTNIQSLTRHRSLSCKRCRDHPLAALLLHSYAFGRNHPMRSSIAYRAPHSTMGTIQKSSMHLRTLHMQCQYPLPVADKSIHKTTVRSAPPAVASALYPSLSLPSGSIFNLLS